MIFRMSGHNNLHVRTIWLDVYKGGVIGNLDDQQVYLDQMIVALKYWVGPWVEKSKPTSASPAVPTAELKVVPHTAIASVVRNDPQELTVSELKGANTRLNEMASWVGAAFRHDADTTLLGIRTQLLAETSTVEARV
jgi:hypothetical protein